MAITIISKEMYHGRYLVRVTSHDGEGYFLEFDSVKTNVEIRDRVQEMLQKDAEQRIINRRLYRIEERVQRKIEQMELRRIAEQEIDSEGGE